MIQLTLIAVACWWFSARLFEEASRIKHASYERYRKFQLWADALRITAKLVFAYVAVKFVLWSVMGYFFLREFPFSHWSELFL